MFACTPNRPLPADHAPQTPHPIPQRTQDGGGHGVIQRCLDCATHDAGTERAPISAFGLTSADLNVLLEHFRSVDVQQVVDPVEIQVRDNE